MKTGNANVIVYVQEFVDTNRIDSIGASVARLQGVVRTRPGVGNNRVVLVDITPQGREIVGKTPLGGIPLLREALKTLPSEQLSVVHEAMLTITNLLQVTDGC